jgi:hypothetical protein
VSPAVLRHVVLLRLRADAPADAATRAVAALSTLPELIPEIVAYQPALDVVRSGRSFDVALIADFADRAALDRYLAHPAQVRVYERDLAPYLADLAVADYQV